MFIDFIKSLFSKKTPAQKQYFDGVYCPNCKSIFVEVYEVKKHNNTPTYLWECNHCSWSAWVNDLTEEVVRIVYLGEKQS